MKSPLVIFACMFMVLTPARAQVFLSEFRSYPGESPLGGVPDGGSPWTLQISITDSAIAVLTEVRVSLQLSGDPVGMGWASDIFVSLNRDLEDTAILLNQVGVTDTNPVGFGYDGWDVVFADNAPNGDVHFGEPADVDTLLTGTWQPDGRLSPTDDERLAVLSVFNGGGVNGTWYLTLADMSPVGTMALQGWSLTFTGNPVPEPESWAVLAGGLLAGWAVWRRRR